MRWSLLLLIATLAALCCGCGSAPPSATPPKRIILLCLDALRYDRLGTPVTPNLNRLAQNSASFTRCYTAGSWTKPSITALFTGKWATHAGVLGRYDYLPEVETTLAEVFQEASWDTVSVHGNVVIKSEYGFGQGFGEVQYDLNAPADRTIDIALDEIRERPDGVFFMYIHLMDPHMPLVPPEPHLTRWRRGEGRFMRQFGKIGKLVFGDLVLTDGEIEQIRGLYDAEVAFADAHIGRLIDTLIEWEMWEDTALVFFADHGEELGDHGDWTHGHCLYNEVAHVPLILRFPGQPQGSRGELTSLASLGGMLLEEAGIDPPAQFSMERSCFMEGVKRGGERKALITDDGWKLIWNTETDEKELYNLIADPREQANLVDEEPAVVESLLEQILQILQSTPAVEPETHQPTPQEMEELRALGYAQ